MEHHSRCRGVTSRPRRLCGATSSRHSATLPKLALMHRQATPSRPGGANLTSRPLTDPLLMWRVRRARSRRMRCTSARRAVNMDTASRVSPPRHTTRLSCITATVTASPSDSARIPSSNRRVDGRVFQILRCRPKQRQAVEMKIATQGPRRSLSLRCGCQATEASRSVRSTSSPAPL
jgi:hypothetical protein